ncbi:hypothetical protein [Mucilaginibacter glaciei]|uniref:Pentapeptide MXKDX repeat protein n=1 Tax=Mucilaginibacter glaciei TaxID=2772109 RepID=A0A926S087_9SPHI|nr:hypothetical protein [Mucilaginibacter glaciei]MBD1391467.1 hypothetical protein [Mucilaginibacter glaciei]
MKKSIIAIALILSTGALSAATITTAKRDSVKKSFTKKDVGTADTKKDVGTADLKKSAAGTKKDVGTAD